MKIVVSIMFLLQLAIQILLNNGIMIYRNTTPMHEDLVTTLIGCTLIIVFTLHELKDSK